MGQVEEIPLVAVAVSGCGAGIQHPINPLHSEMPRVVLREVEAFEFDKRLVR